MRLGELEESARRIGPLLAVDSGGNAVTGEDFAGAGELEVGIDGVMFVATMGTIGEIGDGYYYFAPTDPEVEDALRWIAVKLAVVCEEFTLAEAVEVSPQGIAVGETDEDKRRIGPLRAVDSAGDPLESGDVGGVDVEVTINGAAWDAAAGDLEFSEDGYLYYVADVGELTERGWIAVKISGACEEFVFRQDVVSPPAITITSPDPDDPVGSGGFPDDVAAAAMTPIIVRVARGDYTAVVVRYPGETVERVAYRRGAFRRGFTALSSQEVDGNDLVLSILPDGGWPDSGSVDDITIDIDSVAGTISDIGASS